VAADPAATEFESRVDAGTTFALAGTAGALAVVVAISRTRTLPCAAGAVAVAMAPCS